MRLRQLKSLLNQKCQHWEEWRCGPAKIIVHGRDPSPRFDRKIEIYLDIPPETLQMRVVRNLLKLLDVIGHQHYTGR